MGMRKVNTRGISNANKGMLMAAMAYNLKKYLKFSQERVETAVNLAKRSHEHYYQQIFASNSAKKQLLQLFDLIRLILKPYPSF
jgi:hypothetical protein